MSERRFVNWIICLAYLFIGSQALGSGFAWEDPLMVFLGTIASGVGVFFLWGLHRYPEQP